MTTITNTGVTTTDLAVDTDTIKVDSTNDRVYINRTAQSTNHDALVVSSPAGGVGGGATRVNATVTAEDLTGDSGAHANAFIVTKSKGNYYNGLECTSTSGHVGGWIGHWNGSSSDRELQARVGGTGINASDNLAMQVTSAGYVKQPAQPAFLAIGNNANYITTSPIPFPSVQYNIGNHYNSSNYTFTAPVPGRYFFHVHMGLVNGGSGNQIYPWFSVNGSQQQYSYVNFSTTWYSNAHLSCIFNLSASDTVKVTVSISGATYYNGGNETRFMGYLLG
tara:strand:- start:479 stop:1312 length:834 start_codon:yes stop_codon:yes gene_type:complete